MTEQGFRVRRVITARAGGTSSGPYAAFNLADSFIVVGVAVLLAALAGCRPKDAPSTYDAKTVDAADQIRKVGNAYMKAYQAKHRAPTADELKPYLKPSGDPDALLTSPRDGKSYVLVPNFSPDGDQSGNAQPQWDSGRESGNPSVDCGRREHGP